MEELRSIVNMHFTKCASHRPMRPKEKMAHNQPLQVGTTK